MVLPSVHVLFVRGGASSLPCVERFVAGLVVGGLAHLFCFVFDKIAL